MGRHRQMGCDLEGGLEAESPHEVERNLLFHNASSALGGGTRPENRLDRDEVGVRRLWGPRDPRAPVVGVQTGRDGEGMEFG